MNTRKWLAECHAWLDDPGSVEYQVRTEWHVPQGLNNPIAYPDQNWRIKPRTIMLNGTELPKPVPCANDLMHRMTTIEQLVEALKESAIRPSSYGSANEYQAAIEKRDEAIAAGEAELKREPVAWLEAVIANLVREGVNKHKARELAQHFHSLLYKEGKE